MPTSRQPLWYSSESLRAVVSVSLEPEPIVFGADAYPFFGFKIVYSDVGLMHGLFDHGPVFSVVVQIIFQTGSAIACGIEVRYLLNERKTAWTRRNTRL